MTKKDNKKKKAIFSDRFCALSLVVAVVSLIGFIVENIWLVLRYGEINNRNMHLPFLFGYGLAMLAVYMLFGTSKNPKFILKALNLKNVYSRRIALYIMAFICVCLGESLIGIIVEKLCGFTWWDYTSVPLNLGKYTSVTTSALFALLILFFMDFIFTPLYNFFISLNPTLLKWLSISLLTIMSLDFINSALYMLVKKKLLKKWRFEFFKKGFIFLIGKK